LVIRALPRVVEEHPNTHYVMAGLPDRAREFGEIARELGVSDCVHFLGAVSNDLVVDLLNDADIALLTSRHVPEGFEGLGIAAVEAALCATPSIVTGDSGLAEAVVDGVTGIVVAPEQPIELADAVARLLRNDELRRTLGEEARARATRELTWEQVAARYDELLSSVVAERRRK
jgi:phosphatidylinositol alpha-1,6-mannosyltransferase